MHEAERGHDARGRDALTPPPAWPGLLAMRRVRVFQRFVVACGRINRARGLLLTASAKKVDFLQSSHAACVLSLVSIFPLPRHLELFC